MYKARLIFQKRDAAAYISHLDLMKSIQRSLLRADLPAKYSEGFNPHIYLSIVVPLSTGYASMYDVCDFELDCLEMPDRIVERLNVSFPPGLVAISAGVPVMKAGAVAFCSFEINYESGDAAAMTKAFQAPIELEKQSKRGSRVIDLQSYIKSIAFEQSGQGAVCRCVVNAGNDPLNPAYITAGLVQSGVLLPDCGVKYTRIGIFNEGMENFA